jgi:hypothetical protein
VYVTAGEVTVEPNDIALTEPPLHTVCELMLFIVGTGLTVTVTSFLLSVAFSHNPVPDTLT